MTMNKQEHQYLSTMFLIETHFRHWHGSRSWGWLRSLKVWETVRVTKDVIKWKDHNFYKQKKKNQPSTTIFSTMFMANEIIPIALKNYQSSIEHPNNVDVLCGQDTTFGRHSGNRAFRQRILKALPQYMAARTKMEKMKVTKSILDYMKKMGSRFLKLKKNGSWVEIDGQAARDKVSHALRFAVRQQKKREADSSSVASSDISLQDDSSLDGPAPVTSAPAKSQAQIQLQVPTEAENLSRQDALGSVHLLSEQESTPILEQSDKATGSSPPLDFDMTFSFDGLDLLREAMTDEDLLQLIEL